MPATWRWCAAISAAFRSCSPRRRRRSKAGSMRSRAATARVALPARFAEAAMPDIEADRHAPRAAGARRLPVAGAARAYAAQTLAAQRTVAAVPQPARLCAADAVPGLRPPLPVPGLFELAGRAPLSRPARLPPLRPQREAAGGLPGMRHARPSGRLRAGRRAHRRGGRADISPMRAPSSCPPT